MLQMILEPRGFLVCLTGSVLFKGEGNDIDVLLVPTSDMTRRPEDIEDLLLEKLGEQSFVVEIVERNERGIGLKCLYHELVLDITILKE